MARNHRDRARAADDGIGPKFYIIFSWILSKDARKQSIYGPLSLRSLSNLIVVPQRLTRLLWTVQKPTKNEEADSIHEMYEEGYEKVLEEGEEAREKTEEGFAVLKLGKEVEDCARKLKIEAQSTNLSMSILAGTSSIKKERRMFCV